MQTRDFFLPIPLRYTPLTLACLLAWSPGARAQDQPPAAAPAATLESVVVTGNPLGNDTIAQPTTVLEGRGLDLRRSATLGETLNGLPGVSTTTYGPMVGRPIIRGMDGDRIRILQNGVGSLDASSLSYDHAVPQDPLSADRIEILRGPAALLYGGNAIGGVVNTLDGRIPTEPINGVTGEALTSYGSAGEDRNGAVRLDAGDGQFAIHADAYARQTGNLRIPGYAHSAAQRAIDSPDEPQAYGTLPNSDGSDHGGALGLAWTGDHGYLGLSYSGHDSEYGSVAEEDVRIHMRQEKLGLAGELRDLDGWIKSVKITGALTNYEHREVDDGVVGTTFKNRGYELRIEARHADIGPVSGSIGLQLGQSRFSALGDEALVPTTNTDTTALFIVEQLKATDRLTLSAGARAEDTNLSPSAGAVERFDDSASRNIVASSASLGAVYQLNPAWSLAANGAYTERAPTFYELYANGVHDATGQYLVGNQNLGKERAWSADLALRYQQGTDKGSVGVFYNRFSNYLAELNTGRYRDEDGNVVASTTPDALPEALYQGMPAEIYGVEAENRTRVLQRGGHTLDLDLSGDYTYTRSLSSGSSLPRIPPLRLRVALDYAWGPYDAGVGVTKAFAQHRHADFDTPTPGYYSLDVNLGYRFKLGTTQWQAYARGVNLTNQTIRYATSILRDIAPEPGRSLLVGLRGSF
ncbi:MAG TPA: TonB-dependent receptor [Bordetella sp.]